MTELNKCELVEVMAEAIATKFGRVYCKDIDWASVVIIDMSVNDITYSDIKDAATLALEALCDALPEDPEPMKVIQELTGSAAGSRVVQRRFLTQIEHIYFQFKSMGSK